MQREIVEGAQQARVGDGPFTKKCRIASSIGPFERVNDVNNASIQSNQRVVTHLVFVERMRRLERVDR